MAGLRLEVQDFADLARWRWVLADEATGALLSDHEVRLDPGDWQFQAFGDLTGYLSWHVAPDRRREDEARIVGEVGAWIGSEVLGPIANALARNGPITVRVVVPEEAEALLFRPLELAHAGGRPLSVQDVTLVMQAGWKGGNVLPVGERLRVLGLFSLPEGGRSLNLRRERHSLVRFVQGIAATGKAAEVRVLQYGVTRERLRDVLEEAEGWDIIHVSGHGTPGELLLETAAGKQDRVTAAELAGLLDPARQRVKLVTVAACWSAAVTAAEQRRLLGLPAPDLRAHDDLERSRHPSDGGSASGAMATELASGLGCAVLAMRYPVDDEFAMALTVKLYDLLARQGQPLPRAIGMTLRQLLSGTKYPALSAATPALFGGQAMNLRLAAPDHDQPENNDTAALKMAGFPPQPERFVGRTGVMARSSAALAARSGIPGVLLHGMPGGGKTACALELAYGQEHAFDRLVWYKAPDEGMDITGALTDFALTMERYLDDFQMADALASPGKLAEFLPQLTELMEQRRVLIVIDNAESLLTSGSRWLDDGWGGVIGTLCGHTGLSRLILTSRRVPVSVRGLNVEAVDALSADEVLLLMRELPHLQALSQGKIPAIERSASRQLTRRALEAAQGNPEMLKIADHQAASPKRLARMVEAGDQAWQKLGALPDQFFTTREKTVSGTDYLEVLAAWTRTITETLAPGERDLFWLLCCLEEADRARPFLESIWASLWEQLHRKDQPPDLGPTLAAIEAQGLAGARHGDEPYLIHPGVAAAGRGQAGSSFQDAVDDFAIAWWATAFYQAAGDEGNDALDTRLLVRAGFAAVPYLIRQEEWGDAAYVIERAFERDPSRDNAAAVLPVIRQITSHDPLTADVVALVLSVIDPSAAASQMRAYLDTAAARGDYVNASAIASRLTNLCMDSGRLAEAFAFSEKTVEYARQANLGPWTQVSDETRRLQILNAMGRAGQVLPEVQRLLKHLDSLPTIPGPREAMSPLVVREILLDTGRTAAYRLNRWDDALALGAAQVASMRNRRAPETEIARARFNDYGPLLRLKRLDDALDLLLDCRQIFQDARDAEMLGKIFAALAEVESRRGHGDAAIGLERDALRYSYLARDVRDIAANYHNHGITLSIWARRPSLSLTCHLAATLIGDLTGAGDIHQSMPAAADTLRAMAAYIVPPRDVAHLCDRLAEISGTDLPGLIAELSPSQAVAEQALRDIITEVRELAATPTSEQ